MAQKKELVKPKFVKVKDLQTYRSGFNVYVKVVSTEPRTIETKEGLKIPMVDCILADQTGSAKAFFKGDMAQIVQKGNVIAIRNGLKRFIKDKISLEVDLFGRVTLEKDININPAEAENLNISNVEHKLEDKRNNRQNRRPREDNRQREDRPRRNNRQYNNNSRNLNNRGNQQRFDRNRQEVPRGNRNDRNDRDYDRNERRGNRNYNEDRNERRGGNRNYDREDNNRTRNYDREDNRARNYDREDNRTRNYDKDFDRRGGNRNFDKEQRRGGDKYRENKPRRQFAEKREDRRDDRREDRGNRKPLQFSKLAELMPADDGLNLIVKVLSLDRVGAAGRHKYRCVIADNSGSAKAFLPGKIEVREGDSLALFNAKAEVISEHIEIQLEYNGGRIELARRQVEKVNEDFNLSAKAWVPIE